MQQVNFYQDEFKKIEPPYSATMLVIILVWCFVIGVSVTAALLGVTHLQSIELNKEKLALKSINSELEETRKKFPEPVVDQLIIEKIDALKERKKRNKKVLNYLSTRSFDVETQTFSGVLSGLSQVQQKGLWLTEVALTKGGSEIKLTGRSLHANLLPEYLDQLSELPVFSELEFEVFNMQRVDGQLRFVVSSKREENDAQALLEKITQSRK